MSREIKFRVWDLKSRMIGQYPLTLKDMLNPAVCRFGDCEGLVFLEYTGFKDKTGIEIYEGDVVVGTTPFVIKIDPLELKEKQTFKVVWLDDGCWGLMTLDGHWSESHQFSERRLEVIGNIYENPELLEENTK